MKRLLKSGGAIASLAGRFAGMTAKIAFVPIALSRLTDDDIPLYFLVLSVSAYVGLADTGLLASCHGKFARSFSSGRRDIATAEFSWLFRELLTRAVFISGLVIFGALFMRWLYPSMAGAIGVLAAAVIMNCALLPLRLSVPVSYAAQDETRLVIHEASAQVVALLVVLAAPTLGYSHLPVLVLLGISLVSQALAYGVLLLHFRRKFLSAETAERGIAIKSPERFQLFGCSVIESALLYSDALAVTLLVSANLTAKIGLASSIWLQAMMLTNILLIRVWTNAALRPNVRVREAILSGGLNAHAVSGVVLLTATGIGLGLPVVSTVWSQGRITIGSIEAWVLAGYYLVTVVCTVLSYYLKGAGMSQSRLHILLLVVIGRLCGAFLCSAAGPEHVGYLAWFTMLILVSLLFDVVPTVWLLSRGQQRARNLV